MSVGDPRVMSHEGGESLACATHAVPSNASVKRVSDHLKAGINAVKHFLPRFQFVGKFFIEIQAIQNTALFVRYTTNVLKLV